MARWWRTNTCDRATQWISLDLDGELSQLEHAALARHLSDCARCRSVSAEVSAFTGMLREAPLLQLEREIASAAPRRARVRAVRRVAVSLAFAGVAVVAVFGGLVLPGTNTGEQSALSFRNVQEQTRFAHIEVQRLEPVVGAVVETWCVGNCTL
jgi:predicted anti-sigma-YlaC factor YlaD